MKRKNDSIEDDLLQIAEEVFSEESTITLDSRRKEVMGWDSLGTLNLIMSVEDHFGIEFSEDELEAVDSIRDIYNTVKKRRVK